MSLDLVDKNAKIVVAMSGGVDSSTAVALLQESGYVNIVGMTLYLYENDKDRGIICDDTTFKHDAALVAQKLGIKHYILDYREHFDQLVIKPFIESYLSGLTPSPCVTCNQKFKFGVLIEEALKLNADYLVTGHYIKWQLNNGLGAIYKNNEAIRDQSYFLAKVNKDALNMIRFPLAGYSKKMIRDIAEKFNLHVANKKSSNDICFAGGKEYVQLVEKASSQMSKHGNILDMLGNVIGQHQGIFRYTVGQRKAIGISAKEPLYVVAINSDDNTITVGGRNDLLTKSIIVNNVNWLGEEDFTVSHKKLAVKVRAAQVPVASIIEPMTKNQAKITFLEDVFGVAKGQVCAFYDSDRLMGGGDIV